MRLGRRMSWVSPTRTGVDWNERTSWVPCTSRRVIPDWMKKSPPVNGIGCESRMSSDDWVRFCETKSVVPSGLSTGMIERSTFGSWPRSDTCGRSREPKARSRARAASRALRADCACSPCRCAVSIACCRVSGCAACWAPAVVAAVTTERKMARPETRRRRHEMEDITRRSLVAETDHGILLRGAPRGNDPEHEAHGERDAEGHEHGEVRDDGADAGDLLDADAEPRAEEDAGDATGDADQHRFAEELREDVPLAGAERAPHADLADALEHRGEHDVHDPDATDDERDRGDGAEDDVEDRLRPLLLLEEELGNGDLEVDHLVVPA